MRFMFARSCAAAGCCNHSGANAQRVCVAGRPSLPALLRGAPMACLRSSACPLLMPPKYHPSRKCHAMCSSVGMRTLVCDATFWKFAAFTTSCEDCSCVFQVIAHYAHRCRDAYRLQIRNSTAPHRRRGHSTREPLGCSACWRRLVAVHRAMRRSRWAVIFERSAEWTTLQHLRTFPISGTP